jgi:hypothetical protein
VISSAPELGTLITKTIILAYREDTTALETALQAEGLQPHVQRATYTELEQTYSRTLRCLMNHATAWRTAANELSGYTLVVESDFVPCCGFTRIPAPFDPKQHGPLAWAFLYAGGPRFIQVTPGPFICGHACCPVALLIPHGVARHLADFAERLLQDTPDLAAYSLWDTVFQWHMMGHGANCYMPYRHYGEHGGLPNPEHRKAGTGIFNRLPWLSELGLFANHHAECLHGPLAFLPPYARGSRIRYFRTRMLAKLIGVARLFTGRVVMRPFGYSRRNQIHAYLLAVQRLLSIH